MQLLWDQYYAQRVRRMSSSAIRELLKVTENPGMISFAGGLPAPEAFPVEQVAAITQDILQRKGAQALQYGPSEGYMPLRALIASTLTQQGVKASVDNVLITSGSQQGLDLLARILVNPGDKLLTEQPTYMGALQAWNSYEPEYVAVPSDEQGIITELLEQELQRSKPKFMYVLPNFQNPTGVTFSLERRIRTLELAERYAIPLIEDDPYAQLRFEGEPLPSLLSLSAQGQEADAVDYRGLVLHLGTFSKVLAPGLRLGWVVAHPDIIRKLVQAKQGVDLHTATFNQMIAYEMLSSGAVEQNLPLIRDLYREHRDLMLGALEEYFPDGIHWTRPSGGMFLWVTLPEGMDSTALLAQAVEQKVAFVPGLAFHPCGGGENTMRLNFSNASPEQIVEGIARLGRVLHQQMLKLDIGA